MLPDVTQRQVTALALRTDRPLVVCDVDEVVVHFTRAFEDYLSLEGLWIEPRSFSINGNVRRRDSGEEIAQADIGRLIERFFSERTRHLEAIEGAVEWLREISTFAEVVMLSNLPHEAGDARRENLRDHGIEFPLITNAGPKGPAVSAIARESRQAVVFIDDSPSFITSAHEHLPAAHLVHFLHDERFARHLAPLPFVSLTTGTWREAGPHILRLIGGDQRSGSESRTSHAPLPSR
jgi:hypothetical protein